LGYIDERKRKKDTKNRGEKALNGEVCSIYRKDIGIMVFEARERSKKPLLFMEKAIGEIKLRLTLSSSL
jgi:hypothetical protein